MCSPTINNHSVRASFTDEQYFLLDRGPNYVSPCQMHINTSISNETIVQEQMAPLKRQLTQILGYHRIHMARRFQLEREAGKLFENSFQQNIPVDVLERAQQEFNLFQSIRQKLNEQGLIVRRSSNHDNSYYLMDKEKFDDMCSEYLRTNESYLSLVNVIGNQNEQMYRDVIERLVDGIHEKLNAFHREKQLNDRQLLKIRVNRSDKMRCVTMYFLIGKSLQDQQLFVEPRFTTVRYAFVRRLATFLNEFLQPFVLRTVRSTVALNSIDFLHRLDAYCQQPYGLIDTTRFLKIELVNIYRRFSHERILTCLANYLQSVFVIHRHENLTIDTIMELVRIVLKNQFVYHENSIYQLNTGAFEHLPLIRTLLNIYIDDWQRPFLRQARISEQFYIRYHNQILMTWDSTRVKIESLVEELNQTHADVQVQWTMNRINHFMNVYIEIRSNQLYTNVYRDPHEEPFVLPYVSGHSRLMHRRWFQYALVRAGQYCQEVQDFDDERRQIELTFLSNGYSLEFVEQQLKEFFNRYGVPYLRKSLDRVTYRTLRRAVHSEFVEIPTPSTVSVTYFVHYLYDWGHRCRFNEEFLKLWSTMIEQDPQYKEKPFKIELLTKHCFSSYAYLVPSNYHKH